MFLASLITMPSKNFRIPMNRACLRQIAAVPLAKAANATLTIEPGAVIQFTRDYRSGILVRGQLTAAGSPSTPVQFQGAGSGFGYWAGIALEGDAATASFTTSARSVQTIRISTPAITSFRAATS